MDAYLRGELSDKEHQLFEAAMQEDPIFAEEVQFQKSVQEGISAYRKAELKARLDAIEVTPTWIGGGQFGSAVVKTVAGVVTASLIGVAVYYTIDIPEQDMIPTANPIVINSPAEDYIPAISVPEVRKTSDLPVEPVAIESQREFAEEEKEVVPEVKEELAKAPTQKTYTPVVEVPDPGMLNDVAISRPEVDMPAAATSDQVVSEELVTVDVKTVNRRSEILKYRYLDGKLFLYGDFKNKPYELLEINSPDDRKLYLYHERAFYAVKVTDKVKELEKITNSQLIEELKILRNNKL